MLVSSKNYRFSLRSIIAFFLKVSFALLLLSSQNAYGQWIKKADELYQTAEGNNVVYRNKLYVFGGFSKNPVIENRNEVYDIANNTWKAIAPFPVGKEITHNGIVLVDDNVWVIGGRAVDSHGPVSSQVIIYNITTNKWVNGPKIIDPATGKDFPLGGGGYALLGRTIHVFGGFGPTICEDQSTLHLTIDVDKYAADPQNTTWENNLAPLPIPRNHISYITLGGKIYALGGQFKHDCGAVDQKYCHVYDPETDTWTRLTDLPIVRSHAEASSFALDGKILLVAGQGVQDIPQNTVYEFNPAANNGLGSWTNKTNYKLPGSFLGLSSKIMGTQFIITNGALNNYANSRKETYSYTVARSSVRTLGFSNSCLSVVLDSGSKATVKNLLYVIEDSVTYHITANQSWLSVGPNNTGTVTLNGKQINVVVNCESLSPGKYVGQVKVTTSNGTASTSFCVNLEVRSKSGFTMSVATSGNGTVTKSPDQPFYIGGSPVSLTAYPSAGWKFEKWTGDTTADINPLTILILGDKTIKANFTKNEEDSDDALIENISTSTSNAYRLGTLSERLKYYTDRDYLLTSVPPEFQNLISIITANNDKLNTSGNILSFTLTDSATVYVGYDSRAAKLPAWLQTWQVVPGKVGVDDLKLGHFNIYSKNYPANSRVSLGGNLASPASGALCEYIVFAKAADTVNTGNSFKLLLAPANADTVDRLETKIHNNERLLVYPNPVQRNFKILMPDSVKGIADISITDMYGKIQNIPGSTLTIVDNTVTVNGAYLSLKTGLYSLKVVSKGGKNYFAKVIVQ